MQAIRDGGSNYCGPTSLSAITGVGTKSITRIIQKVRNNNRKVTGIAVIEAMALMKAMGVQSNLIHQPSGAKAPRLSSWLTRNKKKGMTYLIVVTGHMLVVRDNEVVCTQFGGMAGPLSASKSLFKNVKFVWEILNPPTESAPAKAPIKGQPVASFQTTLGNVSFFSGKVGA